MVDQVNTTAVTTYENNMKLALQAMGGDLLSTCINGTIDGEMHEIDDYFGAADTQTITDRHVPIIPTDGSQDRLWIGMPEPDYYMKLTNKRDQLMARIEIQGGYVMQGAAAIKRYWDRQWINGFFGPRLTGKKGATIVPFPSGQIVPYNAGFAAGGSYHMNVEKFIQARTILGLGNADFSVEDAYMMLTPVQVGDLLREVTVTSEEFKSLGGRMSPDGKKLLAFMGFTIIEKNLADAMYATKAPTTQTATPGTVRMNPFWLKSGMWFGFGEKLFTNVTIRGDLHFEGQVYARSIAGGTRTQDGLSGYIQNYEG